MEFLSSCNSKVTAKVIKFMPSSKQ
ncbi:hypothetical protein CCACVL1_10034, partial [Corchorus capsularis]